MRRSLLLLSIISGITALHAAAPTVPLVDPGRITAHVTVLAADAFEGRGPATAGETRSVGYLTKQLAAIGVQPGGDPSGKTRLWTQDVPLRRSEVSGPMRINVRAGAATLQWKQSEQVVIRATQTGAVHVDVRNAPLVFVGYGVTAAERNWDDYKGIDLRGCIALVLVNDPDFETGVGEFGGKAMTYYGRWTYKFEEAARRGAAGVLVIHEDAAASYGWATPANGDAAPMFDVVRENPAEQHTTIEGWIHHDAAVDILRRAGLDYERLKTQARTRTFQPLRLDGVTFSAAFDVKTERVVSKNVVGLLPGTAHPDETVARRILMKTVIYTAHWDHLGIGRPDARGDAIYNGAVDNAAGVAQVLEIARVFAKAPRTSRSVVFLFVTAEEKGLLGSEYYATRPLYPLATTVAQPQYRFPATDWTPRATSRLPAMAP